VAAQGLPADRGRHPRANRNPENYFAEVEQAAFAPSNIVPGIGHSPDKMLQARVFSYADAHRYRLGVNHDSLPVNRPRAPVTLSPRRPDARRRHSGGAVNYEPTASAGRGNRRPTASRRCTFPAMPTATIIAPAMTTMARPAPSSG